MVYTMDGMFAQLGMPNGEFPYLIDIIISHGRYFSFSRQ